MREIKFRMWDKKRTLMGEVVILHFMNMVVPQVLFATLDEKNPEGIHSDDIILMQYTGLKDKNSKEIWEGDIAKDYCCKYIVAFNEGSFILVDIDPTPNEDHYYPVNSIDEDVEIIGNICENPELLQ